MFDPKQEAVEIVGETEFYEFNLGTSIERYTTNKKKINAFGADWTPLPIIRKSIRKDFNPTGAKTQLILPVRRPFVDLVAQAGLDTIQVKIIRGFGRDYMNDYRNPWFVGFLTDITVGIDVVTGNLETTETLFKDAFPKVYHQPGCNQTHYDQSPNGCGVNPAAFLETRTVTSVGAGGRLVSLDGTIQPNDYFTLGRMRKVGDVVWREIMQQAGNDFVLHVQILGLKVGDQVEVLPGCLKRVIEDCVNKFNNKHRNVSMALIPKVNPIVDGF